MPRFSQSDRGQLPETVGVWGMREATPHDGRQLLTPINQEVTVEEVAETLPQPDNQPTETSHE